MERKYLTWIFRSPHPTLFARERAFPSLLKRRKLPLPGGEGWGEGYISGFTFLELLLALAISAILLAGIYASYLIVSRQYTRLVAIQEVQESGLPVLQLLTRDIRMAGYKAVDDTMQAPFGAVTTPITITDSGNACCDSITVVYDKDTATRQRVTYSVQAQTNPTRNVLYMSRDTWNGTGWVSQVSLAPVVEYIEDMQFVGANANASGIPRLVDFSLVFRSKTMQLQNMTYQKPSYNVGNFALTANDPYYRNAFSGTVKIRNVR